MSYAFDDKYDKYGPIPEYDGKVSLKLYAIKYIKNYENITEIPEENKEYIREMFTNPKYKVVNTILMFYGCRNLRHIDTSDWNMSNVTNMALMFANCQNIKSIDTSNWETNNAIEMTGMFANCYKLDKVIGTIHLDKCEKYSGILVNTPSLKSINIKLKNKSERDFIGYSKVTNIEAVNFIY